MINHNKLDADLKRRANRLARNAPPSIDIDDLIQVARIAFHQGVQRHGLHHHTHNEQIRFLSRRITGAMVDELRTMGHDLRAKNPPPTPTHLHTQTIDQQETGGHYLDKTHINHSAETQALANIALDKHIQHIHKALGHCIYMCIHIYVCI